MSEWQKATMDNFYYHPAYEPDLDDECLVLIDGASITVKYDDEGEPVTWLGQEVEPGHFHLRSGGASDKATLHRFPGSGILVGDWVEDGERGMWRIELDRHRSAPA